MCQEREGERQGKYNKAYTQNIFHRRAYLIDPSVHSLPLEQLPGVGHQPDRVAEHDDDADVDTDSRHQHVLSANVTLDNWTCQFICDMSCQNGDIRFQICL